MTTTRFADAVAGLAAAYKAAPALAGVPVCHGVDYTVVSAAEFIIVGHDATTDGDGVLQAAALAGTFTREWADSTTGRDERGSVNCLIACQSPDITDTAGREQRLAVLLDAAEAAALAGATAQVEYDGASDGRFLYRQGAGGLAVLCAYRVAYSAPWG